MAQIVRPGIKPKEQMVGKLMQCRRCSCIFIPEEKDVNDYVDYYAHCPDCRSIVLPSWKSPFSLSRWLKSLYNKKRA